MKKIDVTEGYFRHSKRKNLSWESIAEGDRDDGCLDNVFRIA